MEGSKIDDSPFCKQVRKISYIHVFRGADFSFDNYCYKYNRIFDLTPEKKYTLSDQTKQILKELNKKVQITVFYKKGDREEYEDQLRRFLYESSNISYKVVNLDKNPVKAKNYGVSGYGEAVVESRGKRKKISYPDEEAVVNALLHVTGDKKKVIYFLTGHGERNPADTDEKKGFDTFARALEHENYEVKSFSLLREKKVPFETAVLIISGPKKEYLETELKILSDYLIQGGKILCMLDPYTVPGLVDFFKKYGVVYGEDIVVDKKSSPMGGDYFSPVAPLFNKKHAVTKRLNAGVIFHLARSVEAGDSYYKGVSGTSIVRTDPESWGEVNRESVDKGKMNFNKRMDKKGPVSVAIAVKAIEKENKKEMVKWAICAFGDSDIASNGYFDVAGNSDLVLNSVSWLAREENLISIRSKKKKQTPVSPYSLSDRQGRNMFLFVVVTVPALFFIIGLFVFLRRRLKG